MRNSMLASIVVFCLVMVFSAAAHAGRALPGKKEISEHIATALFQQGRQFTPVAPKTLVISAERTNSQKIPMNNSVDVTFSAKVKVPCDMRVIKGMESFVFELCDKGCKQGNPQDFYSKGESAMIRGTMKFSETEKGWMPNRGLFITGYDFGR